MPLRYVDPNKKRGRGYAAVESFARSGPGQFVARHVFWHTTRGCTRVSGGRYPWIGMVTAPLTSTGAKSGQPRVHQLSYFHDRRDPILVASNAGAPRHPQWYYNLKANPECQFGDESFVGTEVTDPDEYACLFALAEKVFAGYTDYRARAGRQIPILRLKPR
jgi:deazaflavin-dependent oxidoreductase (nitroreductase family)